jgi:shikimate dehydrogenase
MSKKLFAIFGNPVSHSKSPLMHNFGFKGLDVEACYSRYLLNDGSKLKEKFLSLGLSGANITVPHKEAAFEACDELDEFARIAKAVNTIVKKDGKLYGYNTDGAGFLKSISNFKDIKTILILGAGGTAQSASIILRNSEYKITILNRSQNRLQLFMDNDFECFTFENFDINTKYDLIVNMTSAGLTDDSLPAPIEILKPIIEDSNGCIDIIYGKDTPILKLARSLNKPTQDGSSMLLYQGVLAFDYFTNHQFSHQDIEAEMRKAFR